VRGLTPASPIVCLRPPPPGSHRAVVRALSLIVSAILMSRPAMPIAEARRYARVLAEEAEQHAFDPLTVVAIVHFESRWRPSVVSPDGEDYGLGQVRARYYGACRDDEDPVHHPSAGCLATKASLLDGATNLRRVAAIISANRELCKEKVMSDSLPRWLAGYEGMNSPSRDRWCAPGPKTWRVVGYRRQLVAELVTKPALAAAAKARAAAAKTPARKAGVGGARIAKKNGPATARRPGGSAP
jgi:hypothetical protein